MGKIPDELRITIARNIRDCRMRKYPGRGGGKMCAEAFGVSPQQWSPWERGMRTPDELRLSQIADFFEVTVEYLRRDNTKQPKPPPQTGGTPQGTQTSPANPFAYALPGMPPMDMPGSPASFYWLVRYFISQIIAEGLTIKIDGEAIARILRKEDDRIN